MLQFLRRRTLDTTDQTVDTDTPERPQGPSPTIALALGGGAARGFAHIGVIRALIAKGLRPDIITGTSIGAVAGASFAAGQLDTLENWARGLNRRRVFSYFDFTFAGSGIISGDRLAHQLRKELGHLTFADLPLRFAAVATEIGTGHEIWLTRGGLVDALRASYALPGIFPPVRIGGRWLLDGALVNPVPVSVARALGARLVIGVNLNADMFGGGGTIHDHGPDLQEEGSLEITPQRNTRNMFGLEHMLRRKFVGERGRPGISTIMLDAFNIIQDRITRARLAGDPPDVLISPRLGRVGLLDFHRAEESIAIGAEAADKAMETILDAAAVLA